MIVIPIGSYFLTVNTIFGGKTRLACFVAKYADGGLGNASFAGGFAAILANAVLISYIVVAMKEDQEGTDGTKPDNKKNI